MPVRAVTPQVLAIGGGLQFWRDLDGYDLDQDSQWDLVAGSDFIPDERLEDMPFRRRVRGISSPRGSHVRPARGAARRGPSPMQAVADHRVGLDGRSATAPLSASNPRADEPTNVSLGGGPVGSTSDQRGSGEPSSMPLPRPEPHDVSTRAGALRRGS